MNKYLNPPCNSSLATSCAKSTIASSEGRVAAFSLRVCQVQQRGSWLLMRLHQRWVWCQMFVLFLEYLRLWTKARSVSGSLQVLWVARRVLHVILKEKQMTMIVLSTLWAGLVQQVGRSLKAGLLLIRWHAGTCQWRLWQRVLLTHLVCL